MKSDNRGESKAGGRADCGLERQDLLLYAVTDRHWLCGETLYSQVEKALKGGVTFVQLREKDLDEAAFLAEAREIGALCRQYGVPFVINDNVSVALAADADGVHVGQSDMEAGDVRSLIGPDKILGVSVRTVAQAKAAQARGADYLGVGAVFPTGSKDDAVEVDHETAGRICASVQIPAVAIGGITEQNVKELAGRGFAGVAVISAVFGQKDIEAGTKALKKAVKEMVADHGAGRNI